MNKPITKTLAALAVLGLAATGAQAADWSTGPFIGPYVGAAALQSRFDSDNFDVDDVDDEDTGWKILAGVRMTPHFGLEADYTKFGKAQAPSAAVGGPFVARAKAFSAFGIGYMPVGPVDLYAKVGAARIDADGNVGAVFFDDKKVEFAYGAGVQLGLGRLGLRAEYEKIDTDVIGDLDVISLTATVALGARP
jgi:opacity protein-like surface antigen